MGKGAPRSVETPPDGQRCAKTPVTIVYRQEDATSQKGGEARQNGVAADHQKFLHFHANGHLTVSEATFVDSPAGCASEKPFCQCVACLGPKVLNFGSPYDDLDP